MSKIVQGICVAASVLWLCSPGWTEETAAGKLEFDIQAQTVERALKEFAQSTGLQLIFPADEIGSEIEAPVVMGSFTSRDALDKLLAGTGLRYEFINARTVTISSEKEGMAKNGRTSGARENVDQGLRVAQEESTADSEPDTAQAAEASSSAQESEKNAKKGPEPVQEIIVTAQKRSELLQEVPASVTVIQADALATANQTRVEDFYTKVPGVSLIYPRGDSAPVIAIRGITTGGSIGSNPTVATVIDEASFGRSISAGGGPFVVDIDPGDLAQVEVLRGPQGTLYGASALGGLLKYVTIAPSTDHLSGRVQMGTNWIQGGDDVGYSLRGAVNVPLSDSLAIRASGFSTWDPGYIDNVQTGEEDVNSRGSYGGRLSALWRPADGISLNISALKQKSDTDGQGFATEGLGDLQQRLLANTGVFERDVEAYSAVLRADLGKVDIVSASGYSKDSNLARFDQAGFGALLGYDAFAINWENDTEKFSQELRITVPIGDRVEWTLGGYYTEENLDAREDYFEASPTTGEYVSRAIQLDTRTKFTDYAGFTNVTFDITDRFDLQLGARLSRNTTAFSTIRSGPWAPIFFGDALVLPEIESSDTSFTYLVVPRFRLSRDFMVYGRIASGYRPGSPIVVAGIDNVPASFGPGKTTNYEIGLKGAGFNGRLTFDAAAYYIVWSDIQLPASSIPTGVAYTANAGEAKSQGIELSAAWRSGSGFSLSGWFALNDAKLTAAFPPEVPLVSSKGDRLPYSAPVSGNISAEQEWPIGASSDFYSDFYMGASVSYVDDRKDVFNAAGPRGTFPSYFQVDAQLGVRGDSWSLDAFVRNVSDERGLLFRGFNSAGQNSLQYIQPRTVGLNISRQW